MIMDVPPTDISVTLDMAPRLALEFAIHRQPDPEIVLFPGRVAWIDAEMYADLLDNHYEAF